MAKAPSILNADRGHASATALGILCLLGAVQVFMVILAFWQGSEMPVEEGLMSQKQGVNPLAAPAQPVLPTMRFSPPPVGQLAVAELPPPPVTGAAPGFAPPAIGSFTLPPSAPPQVVSPPPQPSTPAISPAAPPLPPPAPAVSPAQPASVGPAAGMSLEELVELAKQVRGLGDMQGALEVLKQADLQYPDHPEVLAETAQSYETMGLYDKAAALWRQIENLDPAQAAGFRDLAQRRLNASVPLNSSQATGFTAMAGEDSGKRLSLGACVAVRDPAALNGEKVVLRIPILRQGNTTLDPSQVDIDVYFFDRVNGEKIAQTIADEPVSTWADLPVDWAGIGEEPLEVTYFLPDLTPGEIAAHGRRAYHGYVVRLYYQHKLQDVAAEPRDLLDFGSRAPQAVPGGVNPLLPPLTN